MIAASALLAVGCVPRWALLRPETDFFVRDEDARPISGARVVVVTASMPHRVYHDSTVLETDVDGQAIVASARKWELIVPIIIHGVPAYYMVWCAEANGYTPLAKMVWPSETRGPVEIQLRRTATPSTCDRALERFLLMRLQD